MMEFNVEPEDWTDLETIQDWRDRTKRKYEQLQTPEFVFISKKLKNAFLANYNEIYRTKLNTELHKYKFTTIEGIHICLKDEEEKEWTLAEHGIDKCELPFVGKIYINDDVKKFIELVKEDINSYIEDMDYENVKSVIDERAGDL